MTRITRRAALAGVGASLALATGCANQIGSPGADTIDARVASTLGFLEQTYPGTRDLMANASGMLVMPLITEAGVLVLGGAYGRGALLVRGATVDYYSATKASAGIQLGAQQYAHVLFFMTDEALAEFRTSPGWVAGADLTYAFSADAQTFAADTTMLNEPVVAVVFGQTGLIVGATVEGTKYTRIIP